MPKRKPGPKRGAKSRAGRIDPLSVQCHKCYARAGFACTNYKGEPKEPCVGRDKPEVARAKYERKAADLNARKLREFGGDNTLLTYLHGGADGLLAAEGVTKVAAADVERAKLAAHRAGIANGGGHSAAQLWRAFRWIDLLHVRRAAARLVGGPDEAALWAYARRVYGTAVDYLIGFYRECLLTGRRVELEWNRRVERVEPTKFNPRGERVVLEVAREWSAPGPLMNAAEWAGLFVMTADAPAGDDDPTGLFERTIGVLKRSE